jgi:hypothetical protein
MSNDSQEKNDAPNSNNTGASKKLISKKINDRSRTITGSKMDNININPVTENSEHTAVTNLNMRAQPVHKGHAKLIKAVEDEAKKVGGSAHIVVSHSEGDSKNPISVEKKISYIKKLTSPETRVSSTSKFSPSILNTATNLNRYAHHLVVVAGNDRADEYDKLLNKYNGKESNHGLYNFKSITVKKLDRDPDMDSENTKGVSGTKMRTHAINGNISSFKAGLPIELHQHAEEMMNDIVKSQKKKIKENVNDTFNNTFIDTENTLEILETIDKAYREAVPRSGQDRKKMDLVPRSNQDRKKDDSFYRQQSIVKKIIDEKYGKGYISPQEKIRRAMQNRGVNIDSDKHRKEMEKNAADYQAILDREAASKKKTNEDFEALF